MRRPILAVMVCLGMVSAAGLEANAYQSLASRPPTVEEQAAMNELGERFVGALRAGDERKALQCWLAWDAVEAQIAKLPADQRPPEATDKPDDGVEIWRDKTSTGVPLVEYATQDEKQELETTKTNSYFEK